MKKLIAFHNDPQLKTDILAEITQHREQDQIIKGTYGRGNNGDWKGCGVGCSIHSLNRVRGTEYLFNDHAAYEEGFGIPRQLAYLEDYLFENLQDGKHLDWPERFMSAIQPGADLELVAPRFVHWLLTDAVPLIKPEWNDTKEVFVQCIELYRRWISGDKPSDNDFQKVAARADRADRADLADLADLAARAARAARADRADLADLADRAARADRADLADLADLAARAARAARADLAEVQSVKLLELIASAPISQEVSA